MRPLHIAGLGHYLPARVVDNHEVGQLCGRSPEWIESRTGVRQRRWVTAETAPFMGAQAAREAVKEAAIGWDEIDLIINASGTPAQALPDGAALLQRELHKELQGVGCFSVHATCLSFLVALQIASGFLNENRNILIISSEITSCALNFAQPESAALFGDGAAAAVVSRVGKGQLTTFRLQTFSQGAALTEIRGGGTRLHPSSPECRPEDNLFSMDGPAVLRLARTHLPPFVESLQPGLSHGCNDLDLIIPHQASKAGLSILHRFHWPAQKLFLNLASLGNTVAASLPLALYQAQRQGVLQRGHRLLLLGTGAGFSLGGALLVF